MAILGMRLVVPRAHEVAAEEFEVPSPEPGQVLLETEASLVSAGTELAIFTERDAENRLLSWKGDCARPGQYQRLQDVLRRTSLPGQVEYDLGIRCRSTSRISNR